MTVESLISKAVHSGPGVTPGAGLEAKASGTTQQAIVHHGINQFPGFQGTDTEMAFANLEHVQAE